MLSAMSCLIDAGVWTAPVARDRVTGSHILLMPCLPSWSEHGQRFTYIMHEFCAIMARDIAIGGFVFCIPPRPLN